MNIKYLIDNERCYEIIRHRRWPEKVKCPWCDSESITKQGRADNEKAKQRYQCKECQKQFDDLTNTIFSGQHQPLKVWVLCLYFMGLNLSNKQIAQELNLNRSDVQKMTEQLRQGVVKKN